MTQSQTIQQMNQVFSHNANNPALIMKQADPKTLTYAELDVLINRCIQLFQHKQIGDNQTLLTLLPNSLEMMVIFLAAIRAGIHIAPLPCTATQAEINKQATIHNPSLIFVTDLHPEKAYVADTWAKQHMALSCSSDFSWLPKDPVTPNPPKTESRLYLATSGTTGTPKAMSINTHRLWHSGRRFAEVNGITEGHELRFWNYLPMSYLGGLFNLGLIPLSLGASVVIDQSFNGKTFLQFWQTVDQFDINTLWLVPTILKGLNDIAKRTQRNQALTVTKNIRYSFIGTAPLSAEDKQQFETLFGLPLLENYGLSETTFISAERPNSKQQNSLGEIMPDVDIKAVPIDGSDAFELAVKTPFLFDGYLDADGNLELALDEDGYFRTGDTGVVDNKHLRLTGRLKDIIKKGGHFVSLREIELVAEQHADVAQAAAVRTEHPFYGESCILFIISETASPNIPEIEGWLHTQLVRYKWPDNIIKVDDFPKTSSGKIQKHQLAKELIHD